jgi:hypothetical protein
MFVVSISDLNAWGCPSCGYRSGMMPVKQGGAGSWVCGECHVACIALADDLDSVPVSWTNVPNRERVPHPRAGKPAHGNPDRRPDGGGEFFWSRGIGTDVTPCCFVASCAGWPRKNIAAFVQCKASGERVVAMFGGRARLDFRESEPDRVQVKVGVCDAHASTLALLDRAIDGGVLRSDVVAFFQGGA